MRLKILINTDAIFKNCKIPEMERKKKNFMTCANKKLTC